MMTVSGMNILNERWVWLVAWMHLWHSGRMGFRQSGSVLCYGDHSIGRQGCEQHTRIHTRGERHTHKQMIPCTLSHSYKCYPPK